MYAALSRDNGLLKAAQAASTVHASSNSPAVLQFAAQVSGVAVRSSLYCNNNRDSSAEQKHILHHVRFPPLPQTFGQQCPNLMRRFRNLGSKDLTFAEWQRAFGDNVIGDNDISDGKRGHRIHG